MTGLLRAAHLLALLVLALAGTAGCGVPTDRDPRPLSPEEVPLPPPRASPAPATPGQVSPAPAAPESAARMVRIYLVRDERLAAVDRRVEAPVTLSAPALALSALLAGPSADDTRSGLRTALNADDGARLTSIAGGVATVDFARDPSATDSGEQIIAFAQLVWTATEVPGVRSIRVTLRGAPVEVPVGGGSLKLEPLTRRDFAALAPSP